MWLLSSVIIKSNNWKPPKTKTGKKTFGFVEIDPKFICIWFHWFQYSILCQPFNLLFKPKKQRNWLVLWTYVITISSVPGHGLFSVTLIMLSAIFHMSFLDYFSCICATWKQSNYQVWLSSFQCNSIFFFPIYIDLVTKRSLSILYLS